MADDALILVNSRQPPTHMTHHHLNLSVSFGIHVIIVFTKIDSCPEHAFRNCKSEVYKLLRAPDIGKRPYEIRNEQDVATCVGEMGTLAPVIVTSCVTGKSVDVLNKMLSALPKRRRHEKRSNCLAEICVLKDEGTTIRRSYQAYVHILNV